MTVQRVWEQAVIVLGAWTAINGEGRSGEKQSRSEVGNGNTDERLEEETGRSAQPISLTDRMLFIGVQPTLPLGNAVVRCQASARHLMTALSPFGNASP